MNTIETQLNGSAGWDSSFILDLAANQAVQCGDKINNPATACETAATYLLTSSYANANEEAIENEIASQDVSFDEEINEKINELVTEIIQDGWRLR